MSTACSTPRLQKIQVQLWVLKANRVPAHDAAVIVNFDSVKKYHRYRDSLKGIYSRKRYSIRVDTAEGHEDGVVCVLITVRARFERKLGSK